MTAILLALVLTQAQPKLSSSGWHWVEPKDYSAPVFDYCRNGGKCSLAYLIFPNMVQNVMTMCFQNTTNAYFISKSAQRLYLNVAPSCSSAASSTPQTWDSSSGIIYGAGWNLNLGQNAFMRFSGAGAVFGGWADDTIMPSPIGTHGAIISSTNQYEIFHSGKNSKWESVGRIDSASEGVEYCFGWNDATPGFQSGGTLSTDAYGAVAATETCTSGTIANTTANQTLPTKTTKVRTYLTQDAVNAQCNRVFTHVFTWANSLPIISFRAGLSQTTYVRARIGWAKNTVFTTSDDAPADNGAWFRYSTNASDTNFMACTGDGSTTSCTSTGVAIDTSIHLFKIDMSESTSVVTFWIDGMARVRKTTNVPASGATLSWGHDVTELALPDAGVSGAKTMSVGLLCVRR